MEKQKKCMEYPCKENAVCERHGRYYCEKHAITIPFNQKCAKCGKEINVFVDVAYDEDYDLLCSKECYLKYFGYDPIWYECEEAEEDETEEDETEEDEHLKEIKSFVSELSKKYNLDDCFSIGLSLAVKSFKNQYGSERAIEFRDNINQWISRITGHGVFCFVEDEEPQYWMVCKNDDR